MVTRKRTFKTDVLIIGSGLAGCAAALAAAQNGAEILMITSPKNVSESNTVYAQGGIIYKGKEDSPACLASDIQEAGAHICWPPAVEFLSTEGPKRVKKILIDQLHVPFETTKNGMLHFTKEGAHSLARIIHVKDQTGKAIEEKIVAAVKRHPRITIMPGVTAVDLLTLSHHSKHPIDKYQPPMCIGAYALLQKEKKVVTLYAKETVLSTGGLGQLFLHTTNPEGARGDGIAMAYRAGARMANLEYIQFHPTSLYHTNARGFLISESLRGEGGVLIRKNGERFMKKYHPKGSLAPRDVVARAIHDILITQKAPCVYLDMTHKDSKQLKKRFPYIYEECKKYDIDITKQPIPVVPAAHYSCGGVVVDLKGRTSLDRLRAIGEVSCTGLHGANRLASTSLLEALTWGFSAGEDIAQRIEQQRSFYFSPIAAWKHEREEMDPALIVQDWLTIKYTMWNYVGLARSRKRMQRAKQILRELQMEIEIFYEKAALTDEMLGLRNGVQTALAVLFACMENHESRGCHYRID